MIGATFGRCHKGYRLLARSRTAFTQPERVSLALAAARSYWAFRASLMRIVRYSRSPFSTGGRPTGLLGLSTGAIVYQQIVVDKP